VAKKAARIQGFGGSFDRGLAYSSKMRVDRPLLSARPRNLLQSADAESGWRRWREGMRLAVQQLGELDGQYSTARLLRSSPFSVDGALQAFPVLLVGFPSRSSPEGRWTVTVLNRGSVQATEALTPERQQEVTVRWQQLNALMEWETKTWRLLRVEVGPIWSEGDGVESDLVGELLEDSLLPDGTWRADEDVKLRMVVAVDYVNDAIYLDGEREWRREAKETPDGRDRHRITQKPIYEWQPLELENGTFLVQSTSLSCNCPDEQGLVLKDWRSRRANASQPSGALVPVGVDPVDAVANRFRAHDWQRVPENACKHQHAVRWALGWPTAEPVDVLSLQHDYWTDPARYAEMEEIAPPLLDPRFPDLLAAEVRRDALWRGLDQLVGALSAADVASVTAGEQGLSATVVNATTAMVTSGMAPSMELVFPSRRFHRGWYDPRPVLAEEARPGDVYLGRGPQIPEPFIGPGETVGEPFLLRTWEEDAARPLP
jgi:hypothetical protein